jgi:hypothetical protein
LINSLIRRRKSTLSCLHLNGAPESSPHRRRRWPARPSNGRRWPSRLVATAAEDRLRFPAQSTRCLRQPECQSVAWKAGVAVEKERPRRLRATAAEQPFGYSTKTALTSHTEAAHVHHRRS